MWLRFKKVLIWTLIIYFMMANFLLFWRSPQRARAQERPSNCQTLIEITSSVPAVPYPRCATLSPAGYTLHLWYGDANGPKEDEEFNFVGTSDWGTLGIGDIAPYVYKSKSKIGHYIAVGKNLLDLGGLNYLKVTHEYDTSTNRRWDELEDSNKNYTVVKVGDDKPNLPDYQNSSFVWRVVVNGTIKLNDSPVDKGEAYIKLKLDNKLGPPLDQVYTANDGTFEFSRKFKSGQGLGNEEIWLSEYTVSNLYFYIALEKGGKKYQAYKNVAYLGDFRDHGTDSNAKVHNMGTINFTSADEVDELTEKPGGEQSVGEEIKQQLLGDTCGVISTSWVTMAIAEVLCAFIKGVAALSGWLTNTIFKGVFNA